MALKKDWFARERSHISKVHNRIIADCIDIDQAFLTSSHLAIPPVNTRNLYTGNPELGEKYHSAMLKYYDEHRMVSRIEELANNYRNMVRDEVRIQLEKWDQDQGRAMTSSEIALSRPPKKCQWSPVLRNAAIVRLYWKLRLREVLRQCDYQHTFLRWQRQILVHDKSFSLSMFGRHGGLQGGQGNSTGGRMKAHDMNGVEVTDVTINFTTEEWEKRKAVGGHT